MDLRSLQANFQPVDLGFGPAPSNQQKKPTSKGKNPLTSLISEGGALGGAAAGAALGSFVPVIGTAIGGIIGGGLGAFGGRIAENKVRDDRIGLGDAAKEGALSTVLSGPLKLAKYGGAAIAGKAGGKGLEEALTGAAKAADNFSIKGLIGKNVDQYATNTATKQLGLQPAFIAKFKDKHGGTDPGKVIQQYGFRNVDDIQSHIGKLNEEFGTKVNGMGDIDKTAVYKYFQDQSKMLTKQAPEEKKIMGAKLLQEVDQFLADIPDEKIPANVLNTFKSQYDNLVNYDTKLSKPDTYSLSKRMADGLRTLLQAQPGGMQLKGTGQELSKLYDLAGEAAKREPMLASRGASPLGLRNMVAGAVGAGAAGPVGGLALAGGTAALNSQPGRQALSKGTQFIADKLAGGGGPSSVLGAVKGAAGAQAVGSTLENVLAPQQASAQALEGEVMNPGGNMGAPSPLDQYSQPPDMAGAEQTAGGSPYSRENLMQDIHRDPKNIDKYLAYYKELDAIFSTGTDQPLNSNARTALASSQNAYNTLDQLEGLYGGAGGGSGRITGAIKNQLGRAGFDDSSQTYNDLASSSVSQLARALNGGGQVSDADAAVVVKALPRITDSPEVARMKFMALKQRIEAARGNTLYYGSGGTDEPQSLETMLSGV